MSTDARQAMYPVAPARLPQLHRWAMSLVGLGLVVLLGNAAWHSLKESSFFLVTNVDVSGTLDYTDRTALMARVGQYTEQSLLTLDIEAVQRQVEEMPWVRHAHVGRSAPGRLTIRIEEHEPIARWNDHSLISKRQILFAPPQLKADNSEYAEWRSHFKSLPVLGGSDARHEAVLDDYRQYSQALATVNVRLRSLIEDERQSQVLTLDNNIVVRLGYEDRSLRMRRFIDVYERLVVPLNGQSAQFDMRYTNGFAYSGAPAYLDGN
ncbi:MAG: cell division protein FtsQ/DivIB [Gammaproteobacteria bacterium]|nr:cell division protein FtsQ/DivIB [Gammaproteobacteria bacterium]